MKFVTLLMATLVLGALAQQTTQANDSVSSAASYRRSGERGRNWGRYTCNLIAVQISDVTVRSCLDTARDIRSDCEDRYMDNGDFEVLDECSSSNDDAQTRRQVKSCVRDRMEREFNFEPLDQLRSSQRDDFLREACENESNRDRCTSDFRRLIDACRNVARLSEGDVNAFDRCTKPIKMAFRGSRSSRRRRRNRRDRRSSRSDRRRRRRRRRRDSAPVSDAAPQNDASATSGMLLEENTEDFDVFNTEAFEDALFASEEQ